MWYSLNFLDLQPVAMHVTIVNNMATLEKYGSAASFGGTKKGVLLIFWREFVNKWMEPRESKPRPEMEHFFKLYRSFCADTSVTLG